MPEGTGSAVFVVLKKKKKTASLRSHEKSNLRTIYHPRLDASAADKLHEPPLQNKATLKSKYKIKVKYEEIVVDCSTIGGI